MIKIQGLTFIYKVNKISTSQICHIGKNACLLFTYRVSHSSHIKLDRVNGSKLRFGGQITKFKKNESLKI